MDIYRPCYKIVNSYMVLFFFGAGFTPRPWDQPRNAAETFRVQVTDGGNGGIHAAILGRGIT